MERSTSQQTFHAWWNRLKSYHLLADPAGCVFWRKMWWESEFSMEMVMTYGGNIRDQQKTGEDGGEQHLKDDLEISFKSI